MDSTIWYPFVEDDNACCAICGDVIDEGEVVCEVCKDEISTDYDAVFKYLDYLCDIDFVEEILTPDEVFDAVVGYMRKETEAGNKSMMDRLEKYCVSDLNNYAEFYAKHIKRRGDV